MKDFLYLYVKRKISIVKFTLSQANPTIPQQPQFTGSDALTFPSDLMAGGRKFYTQIQFAEYNVSQSGVPFLGGSGSGPAVPSGGYFLPLPDNINDIQTIRWEPVAGTEVATQLTTGIIRDLAGATAADIFTVGVNIIEGAGAIQGAKLNPAMFMLFKYQNFKEFRFGWKLTIRNKEEADTLRQMVIAMKALSLPRQIGAVFKGGITYPHVILMAMKPLDAYGLNFKPMAVEAVEFNWAAGGQPAFIDDESKNFPPLVVDFGLQLKELQLWYDGGGVQV